MDTFYVVITLALAIAQSPCSAASLDNTIYARYLCRSRENGFQIIAPGSCSQYYECYNGQAELHKCPLYYDFEKGACVTTNTGCTESKSLLTKCTGYCCGISDGYAVNPTNQQIYYKCKNNDIVSTHCCDGNLEFNVVDARCDTPSHCDHCNDPVTTIAPPCSTTTTTCGPSWTTTCSSVTTTCAPPTRTVSRPTDTTTTCTPPIVTPDTRTTTTCTTTIGTVPTTTGSTTTTAKDTITTTTCSSPSPSTTRSTTYNTPTVTTSCATTKSTTTIGTTTPKATSTTTTCSSASPSTTCSTTYSTPTVSSPTTKGTTTPTTTISTTTCSTTKSTTTKGSITTTTCIIPTDSSRSSTATTTTCEPYPSTTTSCISSTTTCSAITTTTCAPLHDGPGRPPLSGVVKPPQTLQTNIDLYMRYVCRDKPNGFMVASLKSCNQYYICNSGLAMPVGCGAKYFNALKGICDAPENTDCILPQNRYV